MGVAPSSKAHGVEDIPAEVDLKPVMGLIVILIPLLLYSFSFFNIRIQPVMAPKTGAAAPGSESGDNEKKPLNLTVAVVGPGFEIKMDAEVAGPGLADINIPKKEFKDPDTGKRVREYDYPTLYEKLYEIKQRFKEEKTIHITADPDIRWQVIARVMDTSMFVLKKKKFKTLKEFAEAEVDMVEKGDSVSPRPMFPQVVFVVME